MIDFTLSLLALAILWPILSLIAIWLHFANKGAGAFFLQERPGKNGKIFKVIKFKTMTDERDSKGDLLPDADRLTKVGKFVRSTSLDELPQLINVLKGDIVYRNNPSYVDGTAEKLFNRGLCIPAGPCVTNEDVAYIVSEVNGMMK